MEDQGENKPTEVEVAGQAERTSKGMIIQPEHPDRFEVDGVFPASEWRNIWENMTEKEKKAATEARERFNEGIQNWIKKTHPDDTTLQPEDLLKYTGIFADWRQEAAGSLTMTEEEQERFHKALDEMLKSARRRREE